MLEYQTPLELYKNHELIVIGKVISLTEISKLETIYNIKVDEYLKNPKPYDLIDAYGFGTKNGVDWIEDQTVFEIGDRVLLYLHKEDEKYKISPYSFIAPKSCEKHQLLELPMIPGEPDRGFRPASGTIYLASINENETVTIPSSAVNRLRNNIEIVIKYDAWNNHRTFMDFDVEISITRENEAAPVFHDKHTLYNLEPCSGQLTESWTFTPTETGNYNVTVIFDGITTSYDFATRENKGSVIFDKTVYPVPFFSSPMKQIKSGIPAHNISCKEDRYLVSKANNNSPACVKLSSMLRLAEIGWGNIADTFDTKSDILDSKITGGKITWFVFNVGGASIAMIMQTTSNGNLMVTIPKVLTDAMSWYDLNPSHGVLIDGQIIEFEETIGTKGTTITFPFKNGAKQIEIVGTR